MKSYLQILLFLSCSLIAKSQVSYSVSPANTVSVTAPFSQATVKDVYQVNTGASKIVLKWERLLVNLPVGWTVSICDFGACYGNIPLLSTMDTIPVSGKGLLGLNIDPGTIAGSGVVKVYVYQDGYYSSGDTITWNITSSAVGIEEISLSTGIFVYPIPAKDILNVNFNTADHEFMRVYIIDAIGREVFNINVTEQSNQIDVSKLNTGFYNLIIESSSMRLCKKIIKTE